MLGSDFFCVSAGQGHVFGKVSACGLDSLHAPLLPPIFVSAVGLCPASRSGEWPLWSGFGMVPQGVMPG